MRRSPAEFAAKRAQDERTRVFPPAAPTPGGRGPFASTWWGQAWVAALEETSMDAGRLSRGRTYARRGAVGEITVTAGLIKAKVHGSQPRPYSASVRIRRLDDDEWDRVLDAAAARAQHIAALLDRDLPQELAADAARAGAPLLPADDELEPSCSCPDWGYPCKHAAALCYQIARILDQDPFVLLLMRGRDEATIMSELRRRNAARAAVEAAQSAAAAKNQADTRAGEAPQRRQPAAAGTPARAAFEQRQPPAGPPPLVGAVDRPGAPAVIDATSPVAGFDPPALELLAADASARAKALLDDYLAADTRESESESESGNADADAGGSQVAHGPGPRWLLPDLDLYRDAVRLLAGEHRDIHVFARFVTALGVEPTQLARSIKAWRYGGEPGFEVLEVSWSPAAGDLARARALLESGWDEGAAPAPKVWRNRWTFADLGVQLRYGRDGRWHPYCRRDGAWWPAGPPGQDPADVLTALL
ncbi:SWIM zinc finger family protein [Actinocrinis puniceicyclus]|uniref:SWIM zinc finger family protein n=1 Tax=Actinocrinis puniceicyclus TaxID=977794 RepID=A0A8J7WSR0_9ACTN|nr:SWIM zinc finger family protein [Actinocrinis puniceicyclus]MBS2966918.1 SWIM zinc finger family protein [Actinocrinis puniceicyclus]